MGIFNFLGKIKKLNPDIDFSNIDNRMRFAVSEARFNINLYHGSYYDFTNIAILHDIINERYCPKWLQTPDIQEFAIKSLAGVFFHTDLGHANNGLQEMVKGLQPKKIQNFGINAAGYECTDAPFYIFKECLFNRNLQSNGAVISVIPIKIFDGSEDYLIGKSNNDWVYWTVEEKDITLYDKKKPHAYLINLCFDSLEQIIISPRFNKHDDYFYEKLRYSENEYKHIFNTSSIIIFNTSTHTLAKILNHENISLFSFYESNDGDSNNGNSLLPFPINNARYVISGRDCIVEGGHADGDYGYEGAPHIIKNASYRFNGYKFVGMAGKLQTGEKDKWDIEINAGLFHTKCDYIPSSVRLIFEKTD